jgi:hypothetical protein
MEFVAGIVCNDSHGTMSLGPPGRVSGNPAGGTPVYLIRRALPYRLRLQSQAALGARGAWEAAACRAALAAGPVRELRAAPGLGGCVA